VGLTAWLERDSWHLTRLRADIRPLSKRGSLAHAPEITPTIGLRAPGHVSEGNAAALNEQGIDAAEKPPTLGLAPVEGLSLPPGEVGQMEALMARATPSSLRECATAKSNL
jgi:hypothetical protein